MKDENNTGVNAGKGQKAVPTLTTKIGGTTYVVGVHFSKTSRETLQDKIKRMAVEEGSSGKFRTDFDYTSLL